MPPRRPGRRHLQHQADELVLRRVHVEAVRDAFRFGEDAGHLDGVAAERARTAEVMAVAEPLNLVPLALTLLDSPMTAERIVQCLRVSPPALPRQSQP